MAYQCKGLDQRNIVWEYEVNLSTYEKVINEKQSARSSEGQGHNDSCRWKGLDLSNIVCEYEVNSWTNDKVITEIQNFNARW